MRKSKSLFFIIFAVMGLLGLNLVVQAAEYTVDVNAKSEDIFGNTGVAIWDNPVLQTTVAANFKNGWRGAVMASIGEDSSWSSGNNGSRMSATVSRDLKLGQFDVTGGVTYHNLWKIRNVNRDAIAPYVEVSMPAWGMSLFARGDYYFIRNGGNGNTLALGASFNHDIVGLNVSHKVSVIRDDTPYNPTNKEVLGMYDGSIAWNVNKDWTVSTSFKAIARDDVSPNYVVGIGGAYRF